MEKGAQVVILRLAMQQTGGGGRGRVVWVMGGRKWGNSEGRSGPREVKRLDQDGVSLKPIPFCLGSQGCPLHWPPTKGKRG